MTLSCTSGTVTTVDGTASESDDANFIVTEGENASAADAIALAEEIRERVKREQGIDLEYEVELWRANEPQKPADESPDAKEQQP